MMFAFALLATLVGCGGTAADTTVVPVAVPVEAPVVVPTEAAPVAAASNDALTASKLTEASTLVHPMQPWADAEKVLKEKLGEPKTNDATVALWISNEGGKCQALTISKMADTVGGAIVAEIPCP